MAEIGHHKLKERAIGCAAWLLVALLWTARLAAQETADSRAFKAAARAFQDGVYDRAEREFSQFVTKFPDSPMLPEAILLQARAAIKLTNLTHGIAMLATNLSRAGPLADQYRYWIGDGNIRNRAYATAAESFASVTRDFTNSTLLLEASHGEALARFRLRDYSKVIALLEPTDGVFQTAARRRPADELTTRGHLMLAEALLAQKNFGKAEQVLLGLSDKDLTPELKWDRQHLFCRIVMADQRPAEALGATTNLVALAIATTRPNLVADSIALQGELLEQLDLQEGAAAAYTNNLAETVPVERRRHALLHIIELKLSQEKVAEAEQLLESFLAKHAEDAASDVGLLTVGELQLKLHRMISETGNTNAVLTSAGGTNHLQEALAQFEKFLNTQTNSAFRGKAFLDKGWCLWLEGKIPESAVAFKAATESLPWSEDLAQARFKLGDAQFSQSDYTNALASYRSVTNDFAGVPHFRATLLDHVLFQIMRASLELKDVSAATQTMRNLLEWFPNGSFGDRSLMLVAQAWLDQANAVRARELFAELVQHWPESQLRANAELAIAGSYAQESDWPSALGKYREWTERFPTNQLRARAEFDFAWIQWRAGSETNAYHLFTNFVGLFPTSEFAPQAQYWVGDYFMRQGEYRSAQSSFQRIVETVEWPVSSLTYQARLAAGRAAFARQGWKDAEVHFTTLINDDNCPQHIMAEAMFAYGDTILAQSGPAKPLERLKEARTTFEKIPQLFATNALARRLVLAAWGRIGDCSLQLASADQSQYARATNAYLHVMTNSLADVSMRSLAEFGLAGTLEALARDLDAQANGGAGPETAGWRKAAFDHYYNIALGTNLSEGEAPDPFWTKEAAFAAARLKEEKREWSAALNIYKRMQDVLVPLRPRLQEKIDKVLEQLQREKN